MPGDQADQQLSKSEVSSAIYAPKMAFVGVVLTLLLVSASLTCAQDLDLKGNELLMCHTTENETTVNIDGSIDAKRKVRRLSIARTGRVGIGVTGQPLEVAESTFIDGKRQRNTRVQGAGSTRWQITEVKSGGKCSLEVRPSTPSKSDVRSIAIHDEPPEPYAAGYMGDVTFAAGNSATVVKVKCLLSAELLASHSACISSHPIAAGSWAGGAFVLSSHRAVPGRRRQLVLRVRPTAG